MVVTGAPEREKVKCRSHLASNLGDVLPFETAFVTWQSVTAVRKQQMSVCVSVCVPATEVTQQLGQALGQLCFRCWCHQSTALPSSLLQ